MKKYFKLAVRYLKSNKSRMLILCISVIISVMMITSTWILFKNILGQKEKNASNINGRYEFSLIKINKDKLKSFKNIQKKYKEINEVGLAKDFGSKKINNIRVTFMDADKKYFNMHNYKIAKGKLPNKFGEIALEDNTMQKLKLKNELNINIVLGDEKYKLVGIFNNLSKNKNLKKTVAMVGMNAKPFKYEVSITTKTNTDISRVITNLARDLKLNYIDNFKQNERLLEATGKVDGTENYYDISLAVIIAIIAISSILIIYNVFSIYIAERTREFGELRCIGAHNAQIRRIIVFQGIILWLISAPSGVLFGIIISMIISTFVGSSFNVKGLNFWTIQIDYLMILVPFIIGFVSIFIALIMPMFRAGRVSPIEAVNINTGVIKNKNKMIKKRKTFLGRKIDITAEVAGQNILRHRRRFIATVLSLTMGVTLFILFGYLNSTGHSVKCVREMNNSDYTLDRDMQKKDEKIEKNELFASGYSQEDLNKLRSNKVVKEAIGCKYCFGIINIKGNFIDRGYKKWFGKSKNNNYEIQRVIQGLDNKYLEEARSRIMNGKININRLKNENEVILVGGNPKDEYYNKNTYYWRNLKAGDYINVKIPYIDKYNKTQMRTHKLKIAAMVWQLRENVANGNYFGIGFHKNIYNKLTNTKFYDTIKVNLKSNISLKDKSKFVKLVNKIVSKTQYGDLNSFDIVYDVIERYRKKIMFFFNCLAVIITFIGILNVVNTITNDILSRNRELGLLKIIGMTDNQIKISLSYEVLIYSVISSILGIILGNFIAYKLYKSEVGGYLYLSFWNISYVAIAEALTGTIVLSLLSMVIPLKKLSKTQAIDVLKFNN